MKINKTIFSAIMVAFLCMLTYTGSFAQKNLSLAGSLNYAQDLSDVWGDVDTSGNEYALVGVYNGVSIVDVTVPATPNEIFFIPGPSTIWRDLKTWGDYAYVINEQDSGMHIIDLRNIPVSISHKWWDGDTLGLTTVHNIYIDENGFAYLFGSNVSGATGAIILDVNSDPWNPVYVGKYGTYLHDGYVRGDTMWGGEIYLGRFTAVDVTNKSSLSVMGTKTTPHNFTHNVWPSDNNQTLFTTDEKPGAFIAAYDVSDFGNITEIDRIQSSPGLNVIPHNTVVLNDFLVTSYYRDGVTIVDGNKPDNLVEVGNYDTSPFYSGDGFNGCWGVYPFLPSENILAADIENGLYILTPQYVRACYLEGKVTNALTLNPVNNVLVEISLTAVKGNSTIVGDYKLGIADSGTYTVTFSKAGYLSKTVNGVSLDHGIVTTLDVQLTEMTTYAVSGKVINALDCTPIPNAEIVITTSSLPYSTATDASGNFSLSPVYGGIYTVYAGKWGYITNVITDQIIDSSTGTIVIQLHEGYYDDFMFNFGWIVSGNAFVGSWERGEPVGTAFNGYTCNPDLDVTTDYGDECYITGNGGGSAGDDDVDNGITVLSSPVFDLSSYSDPYISFHRWFFNSGGGSAPNDSLIIKLYDGTNFVVLENVTQTYYDPLTSNTGWKLVNIKVSDFMVPGSTMQLIASTADRAPGHLVEAGLDMFQVVDSGLVDDPPFIVFTSPADNDTGVAKNAKITVIFSETINRGTFTFACAPDPAGWTSTWNCTSDTVVLTHSDFTSNATYTAEVTSAQDFYKNDLIVNNVPNPWTFNTGKWLNFIDDLSSLQELTIYPNPFNKSTTLLWSDPLLGKSSEITFSLYNSIGMQVNRFVLPKGLILNGQLELVIERNLLPQGLYFFNITSEQGLLSSGKLLIQD